MRLPLPARIGIYLSLGALFLDFIFTHFSDEVYWFPGLGIFSLSLLPLVILLQVITIAFQWIEWRHLRTLRPSFTSPGFEPGELKIGHEAPISEQKLREIRPGSTPRFALWLGIFLFVAGLASFTGIQYWMATRTFTAVDMPVSLAPGHIRTGPFKINLRNFYTIEAEVPDYQFISWKCVSYRLYKFRWDLYRDGRIIESQEAGYEEPYLGGFALEKGTYDLDVEILSDGSCLNPGHPKLKIYTARYEYEDYSTPCSWASALCTIVGISLLIIVVVAKCHQVEAHPILTNATSFGQHFQWAQKLPLKQPFSGFRSFGIVAAFVYFVVLVPVWVITSIRYPPKGLPVHLLQPGSPRFRPDKWTEPIVVRIKDMGPTTLPQLYVNSVAVSWSDLQKTLTAELGRRPEWVVYAQGDSNLDYAYVAKVIGIAEGLQAKVVLLTPQTEFKPSIQ